MTLIRRATTDDLQYIHRLLDLFNKSSLDINLDTPRQLR